MAVQTELLKATEAAIVAHVALRDVHRMIDEHILPHGFVSMTNGRHVAAAACPLISFYFASTPLLTARERRRIINTFAITMTWPKSLADPHDDDESGWMIKHEYLTIDLACFVQSARTRLDNLIKARAAVESSPDILSGTPVLKGTRIPVHDVAAVLDGEKTVDRVLGFYPGLTPYMIAMASLYARANPAKGRPIVLPPTGSRLIVDRKVPRRRTAG